MNLNTEEKRQAWLRGRQRRIAEIESFPEFKIFEAVVHQSDATAADAVQKLLNLTTEAMTAGQLGLHAWHTAVSLIEMAQRTPPAQHIKLVECITQLQKVMVTDPQTGEQLKDDGYLFWTQLPALGYTAADEWNSFDVANPNRTPEDPQRWLNFVALLAQLSAAADVNNEDANIPENDFSFWSGSSFVQAFEPENGKVTDVALRTACVWALYAADRLWANITHGRIFGKRGDDAGTKMTLEMWDSWQQGLLVIQASDVEGETKRLIDDAIEEMRRASEEK